MVREIFSEKAMSVITEYQNLAPGVDLVTAQYLSDSEMYREYERLRDGRDPIFQKLWRMPKFRRRVMEFVRLVIFAGVMWWVLAIITRMGLWPSIYQAIVTSLD